MIRRKIHTVYSLHQNPDSSNKQKGLLLIYLDILTPFLFITGLISTSKVSLDSSQFEQEQLIQKPFILIFASEF